MDNFYFMIRQAGFNNEEFAAFFEIHERTVKNWIKTNKPPKAIHICVKLMAGELDTLHKTWKGFKMQKDIIISPEGDFIYAWEIRSIRYLYQRANIKRFLINTNDSNHKKVNA